MTAAAVRASADPRPVPGICLLRPEPAVAALVILANDFVLKPRAPGWWSGKLSDVGICFLLPVLLAAAGEWSGWLAAAVRGRAWQRPGRGLDVGAVAVGAAYFALLELSPGVGQAHAAALSWLLGVPIPVTRDVTDLGAVLLAGVAYVWLGRVRR